MLDEIDRRYSTQRMQNETERGGGTKVGQLDPPKQSDQRGQQRFERVSSSRGWVRRLLRQWRGMSLLI